MENVMKKKYLLVLGGLLLFGCTSVSTRGVVAMKISDTEAHVCVGKNEVQEGAKARIYHNECTRIGKNYNCRKILVGDGTLTQKLNEHYSLMKLHGASTFKEGDVVEFGSNEIRQ